MQAPATTAIKTYTIDPNHSTVRFWAKHLMISKVHGELPDVTGTVVANEEDPSQSKIDVQIKAHTLSTKNDQRDAHLRSADFLDTENFPDITFKSTKITRTGEDTLDITGDLTIRGTTRPVTFKAEVTPEVPSPFGGFKRGATARGQINREEFGVMWNQVLETGGVVVGKDIHFEIDLELDRP